MAFRLRCCLLYSSHIVTPYSQSLYMSSINGSKKASMSLLACLGPDMRAVKKRYFRLWHNHGGRLNMHIITGHVLCGFLISPNGLIPSVLSPNLIFPFVLQFTSGPIGLGLPVPAQASPQAVAPLSWPIWPVCHWCFLQIMFSSLGRAFGPRCLLSLAHRPACQFSPLLHPRHRARPHHSGFSPLLTIPTS
jgi:hypothetical protein